MCMALIIINVLLHDVCPIYARLSNAVLACAMKTLT